MHPADILRGEHRIIEARLSELERQIATPAGPFPRAFLDEALDFFRNFADGCHHAKEENLLFPRMKERGLPERGGPIAVMLAEHEEGRGYLKAIRENLEDAGRGSIAARKQVYANARAYIDMLRRHIFKEDNILFGIAESVLEPDDVAELQKDFAEIEIPERFQAAA
jgi:hemerythrin-like domain-containing protein